MIKPVYKPGTTLNQILEDGWSRGFEYEQTLMEAHASGYTVTITEIKAEWFRLDNKYEQHNHDEIDELLSTLGYQVILH